MPIAIGSPSLKTSDEDWLGEEPDLESCIDYSKCLQSYFAVSKQFLGPQLFFYHHMSVYTEKSCGY